VRGLLLLLFVALGLALGTQPALAESCVAQSAADLMLRRDVAATGVVESFVPIGFIFAPDRVYKGDLPARVLVLGRYQPSDLLGVRFFAVMRFLLPGVYSMDVCDGRPLTDTNLGALGEGRAPSGDLPIRPVAVGIVAVLAPLLLARRRGGKPPTPAAAGAY
jgi:hypothetical protein